MAVRKAGRAGKSAAGPRTKQTKKPATRKSRAAAQPDRRKKTPETLRLRSIEPSFTVGDLARSIRFYTEVLGFTAGEQFKDAGGVLRGVMVKAGTCQVGLSQDDWAKGRDRQRGVAVRLWLTTAQDIDDLAARIRARGGTLTAEPADEPWGGRSLSVDDPDGFHLTIYREA